MLFSVTEFPVSVMQYKSLGEFAALHYICQSPEMWDIKRVSTLTRDYYFTASIQVEKYFYSICYNK